MDEEEYIEFIKEKFPDNLGVVMTVEVLVKSGRINQARNYIDKIRTEIPNFYYN